MIKVLELFAGIGACSKALERLNIDHEIVDAVEIDKYAVASFNAVHGTNFEPQDITKWDKDIEVDLIMHGSPCQDFSIAGKQAGGDEGSGTRSSLMYETLRIVEKIKPKYVIWENVKNILSKKHIYNWECYCNRMNELGYNNWCQVLNAKNYGVPQNRERVFTISIRKDISDKEFIFPDGRPLTRHLKDVLESEVDEKYYLSDEQIAGLLASNYDQNKRFYSPAGVSPTLSTMGGGQRQPKIIQRARGKNNGGEHEISPTISSSEWQYNNVLKEPFIVASRGRNPNNPNDRTKGCPTIQRLEPKFDGTSNTITSVQKDNYVAIKTANTEVYNLAMDGDGISNGVILKSRDKRLKKLVDSTEFVEGEVLNMDLYNQKTNKEISQTLTDPCHNSQRLFDGSRIRKLTPKECWRLMGFDDSDFEKANKVNSNTQLYKQAGNSIVVNVLEAILSNLIGGER